MYANVTSVEILSDKISEFIKIYKESVKPIVEKLKGLENLYVLTDKPNSKVLIVAIYSNTEDAENASNDGHVAAAIGKLASTLVIESIGRETFEVGIKI
jgi:hypothetical protein